MTETPGDCFVRQSLAGWLLVTSVFLAAPHPSVAAEASRPRTEVPAGANSDDGEAYLRRQVALARGGLHRGSDADLDGRLDRILSLIASLENPEAAPLPVAMALSEVMAILVEAGQSERAWGLYRASGESISRILPASGPEAAAYRLTEAQILESVGDLRSAAQALDTGLAALRGMETDTPRRRDLLADTSSRRIAVYAALGDVDGAKAALAEHPYAALYASAGRAPASAREVSYLPVRALVAALGGGSDPVAARALSAPLGFRPAERMAHSIAVYRAAGAALALPPGVERQAGLAELGRRLRQAGSDPSWRRPGGVDQILVSLALTQAGAARDPATADVLFSLFQLAGRAGPSFDADALTALGQAKTEIARRTTHQALRLRARRDLLVREQIQAVMARAVAVPAAPGRLRHDPRTRLLIRDFDIRIAKAEAALAKDGVRTGTPDLTSLARMRAVLGPDEAVLAMAPTAGGFAYMCVRRDRTEQSVAAGDAMRVRLDTRLLQAALTATHAPSERLDIQFPVEASVRLHDALIRPFQTCLKPGDRIVWLQGIAGAALPLSALLSAPPPKVPGGYDFTSADWLVRRHAVSYAGSSGAIVAARGSRREAADFDFLGVGDPILRARPGEDPQKVLLRGTRLEALAPLPETKDELDASAGNFRSARVLVRDAATERGLRGEMVGAYRYLSFATHGLLREDLQGLSEPALVLTPVDATDPIDDGLLTASEIADMNLRAAFVALSACNTANFDLTQLAQDLPALASAFAVAGVPATLATLWPVNSETGKRVVADVFAALGEDPKVGSAQALAQAQRRFLAAPPERAYLHPRFWAPFVVLGDGGPSAQPAPPATALRSVEVLTKAGGEVMNLQRNPAGVVAQFISDADVQGRRGAGIRLKSSAGVEVWREDDRLGAASRFGVQLGSRLLVGGYRIGGAGRYVPTVQAYEGGQAVATWRGDGLARVDAFLMAGAKTAPDRAVIAVGELNLRDAPEAGGGRLHVLELTSPLAPRPLFTVDAPPGFRLSDATITPMGGDFLVSYTTDSARPRTPPSPLPDDDYDAPYCMTERVTWLELRDGRTGARRAVREIRGLSAVTALARGGGVWLAGASRAACGEEGQATVVAVNARLETRTLYLDDTLGASDVRTLAAMPDGRTFVAASKANVVDYRPPDVAAALRADPYAVKPFTPTYSGLLLTLGRNGAPTAPKLLDSGSNIYVTTAEASQAGDILLGGALGGQAAIFHLADEGRAQ